MSSSTVLHQFFVSAGVELKKEKIPLEKSSFRGVCSWLCSQLGSLAAQLAVLHAVHPLRLADAIFVQVIYDRDPYVYL